MQHAPAPAGAAFRSRRAIVAATTALLLVAAAVWATVALALPPGGPVEKRSGATVTVKNPVVQPAGSTTPLPAGVSQPVGIVEFSGAGFESGELVLVKIDDGAVRPDPATRPAAPAGTTPNSDDWFVAVQAGADTRISGQIDLSTVLPADAAKLTSGKHLLRLVSNFGPVGAQQGRSLHADFAISNPVPRANDPKSATFTLGPGADLKVQDGPVSETPEREFDGIPKFVAGTPIPYSVTGLDPNQIFNLRMNDGASFLVQNGVADAQGNASGIVPLPAGFTPNPSVNWVRLLTGNPTGTVRSIARPYAVDADAAPRTVTVAGSAQRGRALTLGGSGLEKEAFYRNNGTGNTGDGQTVSARLDGTGAPFHVRANDDGTLSGALPIPAGTSLGTHKVVFWVGYRASSDFPQTVQERTFEVTEFVPDPIATIPGTTPTTPTVPTTPVAPAVPAKPVPPSISSSSLKATKSGRVSVSFGLPSAATRATVSVRTKSRVEVAGSRTKKVVTLVKAVTVSLKAGAAKQKRAVSLKLTKDGRALVKKLKTVKVVIRVAPKGGKAFTKTVNLRG